MLVYVCTPRLTTRTGLCHTKGHVKEEISFLIETPGWRIRKCHILGNKRRLFRPVLKRCLSVQNKGSERSQQVWRRPTSRNKQKGKHRVNNYQAVSRAIVGCPPVSQDKDRAGNADSISAGPSLPWPLLCVHDSCLLLPTPSSSS